MRFWPEVHWSEGQFLRPHHFQAAFRQVDGIRAASLGALHAYGWGFLSLDLAADAIENNMIDIRSCELVLRDGTFVKVSENCTLDPRDFKAEFDAHSGPMPVFFGVPEIQAVRANVQRPGESLDGRAPRYSIEVRRMRGAIFLGDEDRSGFECVSLGKIERTAAGPTLIKNSVPPILRLRAWPPLCSALEAVWNDIRARCEQLGGDASERALTFATASPADMEHLVKLAALNELTVRFGALVNATELHPHTLYMLLCEGIGKLAIWDDRRRPPELPTYNHNDAGPAFEELIRYLRNLVQAMLPSDYEKRPFEKRTGGLGVELDYAWFTPSHELYLGIKSRLSTEDIMSLFKSINFKLASPQKALEVFRRRLPGLDFRSAGTVPNLPKSHDQHYFRVSRTPPYWEHCETERGIFIALPPQDMEKLKDLEIALFVVKTR